MTAAGEPAPRGWPAVFLDRDGTLVEEVPYLHDPDRVILLPGVAAALQALAAAGFALVVVTNQAGVARGYHDEAAVAACTGAWPSCSPPKGCGWTASGTARTIPRAR